jgi:hypothetical protein
MSLLIYMRLEMDILSFINTNIGIIALRRHPNAELLYYTQVWSRTENGEWSKCHLLSRDNDSAYTSGILEAIYSNIDPQSIQFEDWW